MDGAWLLGELLLGKTVPADPDAAPKEPGWDDGGYRMVVIRSNWQGAANETVEVKEFGNLKKPQAQKGNHMQSNTLLFEMAKEMDNKRTDTRRSATTENIRTDPMAAPKVEVCGASVPMVRRIASAKPTEPEPQQQVARDLRLTDPSASVRRHAVAELGRTALPGEERAIQAAAEGMQDDDAGVRQAAVQALAKAAGEDSTRAVNEAIVRLKHSAPGVRITALEALATVAEHGSARVVESIMACLDDEVVGVRAAAFKVLGCLAPRGDRPTISALIKKIEDPRGDVRTAAGETFVVVAGNDQYGNALLREHLRHDRPEIRCFALELLPNIAPQGNDASIVAVLPLLNDESSRVRDCTVNALARLGRSGDQRVVDALCHLLQHAKADFRKVGIHALPKLVGKGNPQALSAVSACLSHQDSNVRKASYEAFAGIANADDNAIKLAAQGLEDDHHEVRKVAAHTLATVAGRKGNPCAVEAVIARLTHTYSDVRIAAVRALLEVTAKGDELAIAALRNCLDEKNIDVKKAVVSALEKNGQSVEQGQAAATWGWR